MRSKRCNISVTPDVYQLLDARRLTDEPWNVFLQRLMNAGHISEEDSLAMEQRRFRAHLRNLAVGETISCDFGAEDSFRIIHTLRRIRSDSGTRLLFSRKYDHERCKLVVSATRFPDDYAGGTVGKDWQAPAWKFVQHYGDDESVTQERVSEFEAWDAMT